MAVGEAQLLAPEREASTGSFSKADLIADVRKKLGRSRIFRDDTQQLKAHWEKCLRYYEGDQWPASISDWVPRVGVNVCKMFVDVNAAVLTAQRPEYSARALGIPTEDIVLVADKAMHYIWDNRGFGRIVNMAETGAGIYGAGFIKVSWDEIADDIRWDYVPPFNVYPDPLATCIEDAMYIIQLSLKSQREVWDRYEVKVQGGLSAADDQVQEQIIYQGRSTEKMVVVMECWFNRGRHVVTIAGDKIVRGPEKNPLETFPYARFVDLDYENKFFPRGIIANVMSTQKEMNERRAQIHAWLRYSAWPKWLATPDVDITALQSNMPNAIITGDPGTVTALTASRIEPGLLASPSMLLNEMEVATGIHDVTQGRKPPQLTAAAAMERLQEASRLRIATKSLGFELALTRLGQLTLSLVKMHYDDSRFQWFLDIEEQAKFAGQSVAAALQSVPVRMSVQPGSTLAKNDAAMFQLAMNLFNSRAIDFQSFLELTPLPHKERILRHMMSAVPGYDGMAQGGQTPSMPGGQMTPPAKPGQQRGGGKFPQLEKMNQQQLQQRLTQLKSMLQ